ncbi:MAG: DUF4446 family protein [Firmicutes bacterium]|nr:DUF4446 family protein [Bacillota bacterium]
MPESLGSWIISNIHYILPVIFAALLISIGLSAAALLQGVSLRKRYRKMMMGRDELNLEELLVSHGNLIEEILHQQKNNSDRLAAAEKKLKLAVAGVALVRYNAFREMGSDLSFSLALLDGNFDGTVLTSLFGREESRCYGKPVKQGKSSYPLSEEEIEVIDKARQQLEAGEC